MQENPFIKVYWIRHSFEVERDSLQTKGKIISRYQTTKLLKIWSLCLVSMKGQKRDKSEFVSKFVGIIVAIIFIEKSFSSSL